MPLAQISYRHDPACKCCPACDEVAAALLTDPHNPTLLAALHDPKLRTSCEHLLRTAAEPPNAWSRALAERARGRAKDDDHAAEQLKAMRIFRADVLNAASTSRRAADQPAKSEAHLRPPSPYPPSRARRNVEYAAFDGGHHPVTIQDGKRRSVIEYSEVGGRQRPTAIIEYDIE